MLLSLTSSDSSFKPNSDVHLSSCFCLYTAHHKAHLIVKPKQHLYSTHLTSPFSIIHNSSFLTSTSIHPTTGPQFWSLPFQIFFIAWKNENFKTQPLHHSLQATSPLFPIYVCQHTVLCLLHSERIFLDVLPIPRSQSNFS